ncbi:MAG: hypothetical protein ABSA39_06775 [Edaphobacter sp.]
MPTRVLDLFQAIEETYEFMFAYADRGLSPDQRGPEARLFLHQAANTLHAVVEDCAMGTQRADVECLKPYLSALTSAQGTTMSEISEGMDASIHFRTLLTIISVLDVNPVAPALSEN